MAREVGVLTGLAVHDRTAAREAREKRVAAPRPDPLPRWQRVLRSVLEVLVR